MNPRLCLDILGQSYPAGLHIILPYNHLLMGIKLIDKFLCISTIHPFIQPYLLASMGESHGNKGVQIKVTVLFNLP